MNLLGFGRGGELGLELFLDASGRKPAAVRGREGEPAAKLPLFAGEDRLSGRLELRADRRRPVEHGGVRVELLGLIEGGERAPPCTFMSSAVDLEPPGALAEDRALPFAFAVFQKPFESYYGSSVKLRYVVRATVAKARQGTLAAREQDVFVAVLGAAGEEARPIAMEVGVEDCLHIGIDIPKDVFGLREAVLGRITFAQVKVQVERMELNLVRKELLGAGEAAAHSDELHCFEIMDGCPARAEEIPVRLFLAGVPGLSPTLLAVNNKFSVRYFLNLVIVDDLKRRYFKQSEVRLFRDRL